MNPFDILIPGVLAIVMMVGVGALIHWRNRPTEAEVQAFTFGYEDGDLGTPSMHFSSLKLMEAYAEGYAEGSRGHNRRADAELIKQREQGETPQDTTRTERRPCTCGRRLRDQAAQQEP